MNLLFSDRKIVDTGLFKTSDPTAVTNSNQGGSKVIWAAREKYCS